MSGITSRWFGFALAACVASGCGDDGGTAEGSTGEETDTTSTSSTTSTSTTSTGTTGSTSTTTDDGTGTTGFSSGCPVIEITADLGFAAFEENGLYSTIGVSPAQGDPDVVDRFRIELYANEQGEFDLSTAPNDSYATCTQCLLLYEDDADEIARVFFQTHGTIAYEQAPLSGQASATLRDVVLVEVEIEPGTFVSTPVVDGDCLEIRDATVDALDVEGWTCDTLVYEQADGCQCGCGVVDPDCADATGSSCEDCNPNGGCNLDGLGCAGIIDPADNALCLDPLEVWTCADALYDAGDGQCDCGCALPDPDCADTTALSCDTCNEMGSCGEGETGCLGVIHHPNNAECTQYPGWTCFDDYYGGGVDDGCDCGCGIVDPDCTDGSGSSCEFCSNPGSCNDPTGLPCPGLIDPDDNALCLPELDVWSCDDALYGAGDDQCDCGCGLIDPDCPDDEIASCDTCNETGSCGEGQMGCPGVVALEPNAYCTPNPGWTCLDAFYDDGMFCDCGCGIADPDCDDLLVASCDFCNNTGSCADDLNDCSTVNPTNNAVCG